MHEYEYIYTRHVPLFLASSLYRSFMIHNYINDITITMARARDLALLRSLVIHPRKPL